MIARLLISSSLDVFLEEITRILDQAGLTKTHPDLLYFAKKTKLGIEQSRKIKEHFSLKPYSAKGRAVVLEDASDLTTDAQNALLKTFEELPDSAILIMGADSDTKFLPTILSRCQVVRIQSSANSQQLADYNNEIEKLLNQNTEDRFEYIEKLKEKDEFLRSLVSYFHQKLPSYNLFSKELLQAEAWKQANVNIRAVLEYLMLVMPTHEPFK